MSPTSDDTRPVAFHAADPFGSDAADALPTNILVAPFGEVCSTHGIFLVDAESMRLTIDAFNAHATDLPIDFEHQSLGGAYSSPNGLAPAAGWIKSLAAVMPPVSPFVNEEETPGEGGGGPPPEPQPPTADEGVPGPLPMAQTAGLWARVEWTPQAMELLRTRQYRYLSPVALVRRSDQRMIALHSVALTNKPAIVGMQPIVNRDTKPARSASEGVNPSPTTETPSVASSLRPSTISIPVHTPESISADAWLRLRTVLNLETAANESVILLAATQRIESLQHILEARSVADRVQLALSAGKLAPAQHDWACALALRDPAAFDEWLSTAPQLVSLGRTQPPRDDAALLTDAVSRRARDEYRANAATLSAYCTEEAYIADALRTAVP